jgi:hypothetical protein
MKESFEPIEFRHVTIGWGDSVPTKDDELVIECYVMTDKRGVQLASSTNLASLIEYAVKCDVDYELSAQFLDRKLGADDYLATVDIDAQPELPSGLMVPGMAAPGGTRLN